MRVLLNLVGLRHGGARSVGLGVLRSLPRATPDVEYVAVTLADCGFEDVPLPPNCDAIHVRPRGPYGAWRLYFDNVVLPRLFARTEADLTFSLKNNGVLRPGRLRQVLLVQNAFLVEPLSAYGRFGARATVRDALMAWLFRRAVRAAPAVVCQTEAVRRRLLGLAKAVHVVPNQVLPAPSAETEVADRLAALPGVKVLCLARYYPHKNLERACAAAAQARAAGHPITLCLTVGDEGARLARRVAAGEFGDAVVNLGTVPLGQVAATVRAADAVCLPSLLESYSGTYLEAFGAGRPVLTSDRDFAREVCGDAALYVEPTDVAAIAAGFAELADAGRRAALGAAGAARGQGLAMGWRGVAERLGAVLTDVSGSARPAA